MRELCCPPHQLAHLGKHSKEVAKLVEQKREQEIEEALQLQSACQALAGYNL